MEKGGPPIHAGVGEGRVGLAYIGPIGVREGKGGPPNNAGWDKAGLVLYFLRG